MRDSVLLQQRGLWFTSEPRVALGEQTSGWWVFFLGRHRFEPDAGFLDKTLRRCGLKSDVRAQFAARPP